MKIILALVAFLTLTACNPNNFDCVRTGELVLKTYCVQSGVRGIDAASVCVREDWRQVEKLTCSDGKPRYAPPSQLPPTKDTQ